MSKRGLSPDILPTAKRRHTVGTRRLVSSLTSPVTFDKFLYDELILHIFSHLNWGDLCSTQPVSRNWARLAGDNELWRKLYVKEFGRSRLRGSRGFIARQDWRGVRPIPAPSESEQYKEWKWMFRISSNWRRGRCIVDEVGISLFDDVATPHFPTSRRNRGLLMLLAGSLIITASCLPTERPCVALTGHDYHGTFACEPTQPGLTQITALALDQSLPRSGHLYLAIVLSTGEIFIFSFSASDPSSLRQSLHYRPSRHSSRTNIVDAAYHHPLLVTLADPFSLSLFDLSSGSVRHTQTLSTFTCYPPASLVLSSKCATQFKLIITYTIPVYPHHWSVGATEIRISRVADTSVPMSIHTDLSPSLTEDFRCSAYTMAVVSTRTIRAFDVPNGWIDNTALITMREQWGRKLLNVASVQTDGKWVILAPGNDLFSLSTYSHGTSPTPSTSHVPRSSMSLQLYRLVLPSHSNSVSASPPKLNFVRTLHGHTSPISAVALADGRCISLGENGSIWVWDLEAGSGAEVTSPDKTCADAALPPTKGVISFDERRIVSAIAGKVVVRRFDI